MIHFFYLFGELFLTELVKCEELPGQLHIFYKPTTGQFYSHNDLTIWNHHGNSAEVDLQIFRKFLATCITRVLKI